MIEQNRKRSRGGGAWGGVLLLLASGLSLTSILGCANDDVRFGLPGGLRSRREGNTGNASCPLPAGADGTVCPDWGLDIHPLFGNDAAASPSGFYGCALASCHGTAPGGAGLFISPTDARAAYDSMSAFKNAGRPYIGPEDSYILCNLSPDPDVKIGSLMPLVGGPVANIVDETDLVTIGNWLLCGAPPSSAGAGGAAN